MDDPALAAPLPLSAQASISLEDQLQRQSQSWMNGSPIAIEKLLEAMIMAGESAPKESAITEWNDCLLTLISHEVVLRERAGEQPSLNEYQQRFPAISEALHIQWQIDQLLNDQQHSPPPLHDTLPAGWPLSNDKLGPSRKLGRYEVLSELGRGATGVVYKAWDPRLKRLLAIKRLREGMDADPHALARLRSEAEAIARIDHPHIVKIFEVVEIDGQPILAMEYCDGQPLSRRLDGNPLPPRLAAELVRDIAQAVAAVHQARIIHRDLKPGNVLLTGSTTWHPKVSDFGLAKLLDVDSGATTTGSILGTPAYMAPEQAFGDAKHVGAAADIYSLGAILYECLTGGPPFRGATVADTLEQVRNRNPVSVRQLAPQTPIDLETIAMKCLRKSPPERYGSVQELIDDLEKFLSGQLIAARPISEFARAWRWCLANPRMALLLASVLVLLSVTVLILWDRNLRIRAESLAKSSALRERSAALVEKDAALAIAAANETLARKRFYAAEMNLAQQAFQQDQTARVLELLEHQRPRLGQVDLRGFEWDYLYNQIHKRLHRTWTIDQQEVNSLAFSPDGRWLAVCSGNPLRGQIAIWAVATGELQRVYLRADANVSGAVFSPDSRFLLSGLANSGVGIWEVQSGNLRAELPTTSSVRAVTWSADNRWLAAGCFDGQARIWNAHTHQEIDGIQDQAEEVFSVVISDDGKRLYLGRGLEYDKTYTDEYRLDALPLAAPRRIEGIRVHDVTPDGKQLLGVRWGEVHLREQATDQLIWSNSVTTGSVSTAQFSADGERFVRGGNSDRTAEIWSPSSSEVVARIAHRYPVSSVAFDPLARYWATGSEDGVVNVWRDEMVAPLQSEPHQAPVWRIALSNQNELFLGGPFPAEVRRHDGVDPTAVPRVRYLQDVSADGQIIMAVTPTLDTQSTTATAVSSPISDPANNLHQPNQTSGAEEAFPVYSDSPPPGLPETVEIWDRDQPQPRIRFQLPDSQSRAWRAIALARSGQRLATRQWDGPVRLWDVTGQEAKQLLALEANCLNLCFSPDDQYLAACCEGNLIRVWRLATGHVLSDFVVEESARKWAVTAEFSPDGRYLAAGNGSGVVRVWEIAAGRELSKFTAHIGEIHSLAFIPNGRTLAVAGVGPVSLWDFETGQELISLPVPDYKTYQVAAAADGQTLITCSDSGDVHRWQISP